MSTVVSVNTYAHTATHVATKLLYSLQTIIREAGLDTAKFAREREALEEGVAAWLRDQDLVEIILEVFDRRTGELVKRWDLEIEYGYAGDGTLWTDTYALKHAIAKSGHYPSGCDFTVIVRTKPGARDLPGWGSTRFRDTAGFSRFSVGSTIGGNGIASEASYWSK